MSEYPIPQMSEHPIPEILRSEPILWAGVDSTTPGSCYLVSAHVVGLVTTYIVRSNDGVVLGRIEPIRNGDWDGYLGSRLKGGTPVFGCNRDFGSIAAEIVTRAQTQGA